ncbi:MAG: BlaI/MecI/CopY family transcriptional regulator [Maricaulis sp.]|jgi:predicted transcriptional regulator|uniref:BlaI/MecI/CopY family transcriptional regulator n=1 Tax=Maricaulis sp. TaxID=1486257 RepID=UPI001B1EAFEE|nr:BlaI/MecI/CopY family transcriptional regulator [Maricaulis sp.]MEC9249869.1 BlaI/MecI/CopY family transcriptional regulator [Pseudomonadota bacterium]MBO6730300.1 BlaI/MecI/CopY family transcriptional regulator [Maricaulis sp.]MBO6846732.1 BlaI/MecI/CopY family transcriptional regulator [Maricaulis sp.]MBO6877907.1 BlaI/MecI/CopY family transcriptional regulator [Maricaulis sp.]MDM7985330.1 BlaI/MecI/CopY family transcriptional regulator [Maricaulis sp.]
MADQAPSQAELIVLKQLWASGEQSAREVHERVATVTDWSYSTTRTLLARMVQKGLVEKRDSHGLALYEAAETKVTLIGKMVKSFSQKVLELDGSLPVSAFSDSKLLDEGELDELSRLLEEDEDD